MVRAGFRLRVSQQFRVPFQARSFELLELGFDLPAGAVLQNVSFSGPAVQAFRGRGSEGLREFRVSEVW